MDNEIYEFLIKDKQGNALVTLDGARNAQFNFYLNRTPDASFDISLDDPKIDPDMLLLGDKELYIYRKGVLLWGGELATSSVVVDDVTETATITAKGFIDLLSKKIVGSAATPRSFTSTDAGSIISTLLSEVQTGTDQDFGITAGTIQTSVNRTIEFTYKDLKSIIQDLCTDNIDQGFDFDIDPTKKLNIWFPQRGTQRPDIIFEYGRNMIGFQDQSDATDMANEIIVLGSGDGPGMDVETVDESSLQPSYKIRTGVISKKDISDSGVLIDMGKAELSLDELPKKQLMITLEGNADPILGTYNVGDSPKVIINKGWYQINDYYRIYQISVTLTDDGEESVQVTLNPFINDFIQDQVDIQQRLLALESN